MDCILLFDIDGTLVSRASKRRSAGVRAMSKAAFDMTGRDRLAEGISFAGATDLDVARQLLEMGGIASPTEAQKTQLLDYYVSHIQQLILEDSYFALGAPRDVIPKLHEAGAVIGLGTGNVRAGAECKLHNAGIGDLFQFDLGGYGDDGEARAHILQVAVERCRPHARSKDAPVIVIGDTPKDVLAAKEIGAECIGIPSGSITVADLKSAGAIRVVKEVSDELIFAIEEAIHARFPLLARI
ncbi:MAG: HAD family hydrolase [Deltaproteobacteria bacterium]|nr:HAD family hydrolase [Deltaproteobacteria bacterium]